MFWISDSQPRLFVILSAALINLLEMHLFALFMQTLLNHFSFY